MRLRAFQVRTIARREFVSTVRRRAYVLTLVLMPLYLVFVLAMGALPSVLARRSPEARVVGFVDPGRALGLAAGAVVAMDDTWTARGFADFDAARRAFARGELRTIVVLAPDYLAGGQTVRYRRGSGLLTGPRLGPPIAEFMRSRLLAARLDPTLAARAASPLSDSVLVATPHGTFESESRERRLLQFLLPFGFSFVLSIGIFTAGGYLMQGLGEEKESRILESLVALVTPDELMLGKMLGLGAAGLGLVVVWGALGALALVTNPAPVSIGAGTALVGLAYFFAGYFLFGSFMLGVGSLVTSYQEANQWTALISLSAVSPFFALSSILDQPNGSLATALSLFPWTSPVAMMMRVPSGEVPAWQIALSLALLVASAALMLRLTARVFRVGLLLYGKTPNLPEILRWARRG